jgi:hypothetical protein
VSQVQTVPITKKGRQPLEGYTGNLYFAVFGWFGFEPRKLRNQKQSSMRQLIRDGGSHQLLEPLPGPMKAVGLALIAFLP